MQKVVVVGGGVIGLTTAIRLAESGRHVSIISGQEPQYTTSVTAAAYWAPYWIGDYDRRWASDTLAELQKLASVSGSAVTITPAEEWLDAEGARELDDEVDQAYWWRHLPGINWTRGPVDESRSMTLPGQSRTIQFAERVQFQTPVARMPDYLSYLVGRFGEMPEAHMHAEWVDSLEELLESFDYVVNCTGWQAKHLIDEERSGPDSMRLLAGYVVRMPQIPGMPLVTLHRGPFRDTPLYMVPRWGSERDMICGGTAILTEPAPPQREPVAPADETIYDQIIERCTAFEPRLAQYQPLDRLIGLRPVRKAVRLEHDSRQPRIVHHYGHGGAGLTLSWGSADAVVRLMDAAE